MTAASELPPEAIRLTREHLGIGLKEAKEAVRRHRRAQPPALADTRGARVPGGQGPVLRESRGRGFRVGVVLLLLLVIAALLAWRGA